MVINNLKLVILVVLIIGTVFGEEPVKVAKYKNEIEEILAVEEFGSVTATYTQGVLKLIDRGVETLKDPLFSALLSEDIGVRQRAYAVVSGVTMRMYGFKIGKGWPSDEAREAWIVMWKANGNYDPMSKSTEREKAVIKLRENFLEDTP